MTLTIVLGRTHHKTQPSEPFCDIPNLFLCQGIVAQWSSSLQEGGPKDRKKWKNELTAYHNPLRAGCWTE
jgi:hypothetical protein